MLVCRPITSRRLQEKINIAEDERGVVFSKVPYVNAQRVGSIVLGWYRSRAIIMRDEQR